MKDEEDFESLFKYSLPAKTSKAETFMSQEEMMSLLKCVTWELYPFQWEIDPIVLVSII